MNCLCRGYSSYDFDSSTLRRVPLCIIYWTVCVALKSGIFNSANPTLAVLFCNPPPLNYKSNTKNNDMIVFRIGFLGRYVFTPFMRDYLDTLISRYTCEGVQLWIVMDLISADHLQLAERVITVKRICPDLRLSVVITERQKQIYKRRSESFTAKQRKRILDAADNTVTLPGDSGEFMRIVFLNRCFIKHCDLIVYSTYRAPLLAANNFDRHLRSADNPPRVQYISDEYPLNNPVSFEPALMLAESIDYIRRNNYRVMSDTLPPELLAIWLKDSDEPCGYSRLSMLEDVADLFRLQNSAGRDFLLFKIFAYAYAHHRDLWVLPQYGFDTGVKVSAIYRQFRRLLELVADAREKGAEIGNYNLLDFDNYDALLNKCGWVRRLEEMNTHLCDE